jgi:hypothetical protein
MKIKLQKTLLLKLLCISCVVVFSSINTLAQKSDSIYYISRSKKVSKTPTIKANVQSYKPTYNSILGYIPFNSVLLNNKGNSIKQEKALTVSKVFPNPIDDQISLTYRMDKEGMLTIKIMDLLGNEVVTLCNERSAAGEQTKTFMIPNRLNSGIYFLRIVAGAETVVKRISVL